MLINVRGSFGSGKSTLVRNAVQATHTVPLISTSVAAGTMSNPNRMVDKILKAVVSEDRKVAALGSYKANCGGADEYTWKGAHDAICDAIRLGGERYPLFLFEGVTIAGIYQRYVDLATELGKTGTKTLVIYNMPPVEVCIERVMGRTGKDRTERLVASVTDKWNAVQRTYERMSKEAGPDLMTAYFTDTDEAQEYLNSVIEAGRE